MKGLFTAVPELGLQHRIAMAPLTRVRGTDTFAPGPTAVQYYSERATPGGLLITEGSPISPETQYEYAAGIYTAEQEAGWRAVCDAVHAKGGLISIQLWHLGRMRGGPSWAAHPFLKSLGRPTETVSCSATTGPGQGRKADGSKEDRTPARELTVAEIEGRLVNDFVSAAQAAKRAGFDFVEVHAAHGYLFDQFFCDSTNLRTDEYGCQTPENRTRALTLVLRALINVMGSSKRVAIRVSPTHATFAYQACKDSDPLRTYTAVVRHLDQFDLGYLLISEPRWNGGRDNADPVKDPSFAIPVRNGWVKSLYRGFVIGSSSFTPETAEQAVRDGVYDAIAFGRFFLSNPDLVERIRQRKPLNDYNVGTFYGRDPIVGYVDYPTYDEAVTRGAPRQIAWADMGSQAASKNKL